MSIVTLYVVLVQATLTSFSGFGSLAQVRRELVIEQRALSDEALNRAVLVARTTPGPIGVYVVSVGYEVAGVGGAFVGWLALSTPALLVIPLFASVKRSLDRPHVRGAIDALILTSALLVAITGVSLCRDLLSQLGALQ